jgi:hypothetical protein
MKTSVVSRILLITMLIILLLSAGCAPGNDRFVEKPAGFWSGLWHGLICVITFIISLFSKTVRMYETANTGGWYNFGFLLGAAITLSSGGASGCKKMRTKSANKKEWEEISEKVEAKVKKGIQNWADESDKKEDEWKEIGRKVEEKIKRELKNWADKE